MIPIDGLVEGVTYHNENRQPYVLTRCAVCGKPKISTLYNGEIRYPLCSYCANHTDEHRDRMRRTFKGKPKTEAQKQKLRESSTGNKNCQGRHLSDATKAKLSRFFKGRKLSEETKRKMSVAVKARPPRSAIHRQRLSESLKGRKPDDKVIQASIIANTGRFVSEESKNIRRRRMINAWSNPDIRNKILINQKESCNTPEHKLKCRQNSITMWANRSIEERNSIIQNMIQSSNKKPNKKELWLMNLINIACPNEYKYTGDGSFVIGGKIPDYTNINGHKKIIEMFGDYYHNDEIFKGKVKIKYHRTEQGCKEIYAQYGFDCLVIWEKELKHKSPDELIKSIRDFTYGIK